MNRTKSQPDSATTSRQTPHPATRTAADAPHPATRRHRRKRRTSRKLKLLHAIQTARSRDKPNTTEAALLVVQTLKEYRGHRIGHACAMQAISDALGILSTATVREALRTIQAWEPRSRKTATRHAAAKGGSRHEA